MTNNTANGINCRKKMSLLIVFISIILLVAGILAGFKTWKFGKNREVNKGWFLR